MATVLHIIDRLSAAGPTRSLITLAALHREAGAPWHHRVVTLQPELYPQALLLARRAGLEVRKAVDAAELALEITQADIVQLHYWNNPALLDLLGRSLPPHRRILWLKIAGGSPPQVVTEDLAACADVCVATASLTLRLPALKSLCQQGRAELIPGLADFQRVNGCRPTSHAGIRAGYLGTVNFSKMHPSFVAMSAATSTADLSFPVAGSGGGDLELKRQAEALGASSRFSFHGFQENIATVLETLDIFGYPLCHDTYATSEKCLQEAMAVAIPPVVFPHGGVPDLVEDGVTGRVVGSPEEYTSALDHLARDPAERQRLGAAARRFVRRVFDPRLGAAAFTALYGRVMDLPRREQPRFAPGLPAGERFARILNGGAAPFLRSMQRNDPKADRQIAASSFLLAQGEGGIIQFRNAYPNDPWLRHWSSIVLAAAGRHEAAARERAEALRLGWPACQVPIPAGDPLPGGGDG